MPVGKQRQFVSFSKNVQNLKSYKEKKEDLVNNVDSAVSRYHLILVRFKKTKLFLYSGYLFFFCSNDVKNIND